METTLEDNLCPNCFTEDQFEQRKVKEIYMFDNNVKCVVTNECLYCKKCNKGVATPELLDKNLKNIFAKYREVMGKDYNWNDRTEINVLEIASKLVKSSDE